MESEPKGVGDPLNRGAVGGGVDGDHIETHRGTCVCGVLLDKPFGAAPEALLFTHVDAFGGVGPTRMPSVTNLDKYGGALVAHDQINLARFAAVISVQAMQAPLFEPGLGNLLPMCALDPCGHVIPKGRR
jgi:hypothetical protein